MPQFMRIAILSLAVLSAPTWSVRACTIFSVIGENGHVWNGNNEDARQVTENVYLNVYPKKPDSLFGYFTLTYDNPDTPDIQGGMNEAGLTLDFNALDRAYPVKDRRAKQVFPQGDENVIPHILANFRTAEEVVAFFEKHWLASDEAFTKSQMHVADKQGHFAIIGPSGHRIWTDASSQVSTNFNICADQDGSSCWRFPIAEAELKKRPVNLRLLIDLCAKTSQQGTFKTVYSNIQNLTTGDVWFFYDRAYGSPYRTNIRDLLEAGRKSFRIGDLCKRPATETGDLGNKIRNLLQDYKVPAAAVAIIDPTNNESSWLGAFGERIPGSPAKLDTIFNMASLTKPVFGMMALQVVANGELELDSNLDEHWIDPDIAGNNWHKKLTPRLLLSHQSGFPNWRNGKLAFQFEPGTKTVYSGEGIDYLRRAIELKSGKGMPALMEEHVLKKASMKNTSFGWDNSIVTRFAPGHEWEADRGKFKVADFRDLADRKPSGAGSMFSTIGDYAKFVEWVLGGANLPAPLLHEMQKTQATHSDGGELIGLAWHLIPGEKETIVYHEGREPGIYTLCVMLPESKKAVVVLTNGGNGELLAKRLIETVLPNGSMFMQAKSNEMWRTLRAMSGDELDGIIPVIASSPTYMATVFGSITSKSDATPDKLVNAKMVFDQFVSGMINGDIEAASVEIVLDQIVKNEGKAPAVKSTIGLTTFERVVETTRRHMTQAKEARFNGPGSK